MQATKMPILASSVWSTRALHHPRRAAGYREGARCIASWLRAADLAAAAVVTFAATGDDLPPAARAPGCGQAEQHGKTDARWLGGRREGGGGRTGGEGEEEAGGVGECPCAARTCRVLPPVVGRCDGGGRAWLPPPPGAGGESGARPPWRSGIGASGFACGCGLRLACCSIHCSAAATPLFDVACSAAVASSSGTWARTSCSCMFESTSLVGIAFAGACAAATGAAGAGAPRPSS